jgi:hypothetical protein
VNAENVRAVLDAVAGCAQALRAAGVLRVRVEGGVELDLAPDAALPVQGSRDVDQGEYVDPLEDPDTFAMGGRVPGFQRRMRGED